MKEQLTDLQLAKIATFVADKEMFDAVRTVLLAKLYTNGVIKKGKNHNPLVNGTFQLVAESGAYSNEQLGEQLRGDWAGVNMVEAGFDTLKTFSDTPDSSANSDTNIAE